MNPDPDVLIHDWCRGELGVSGRNFLVQWLETEPDAKRRFREAVIEFRMFAQASHERSVGSRVDRAVRRTSLPALALGWQKLTAAAVLAAALGAGALASVLFVKSHAHRLETAQARSQPTVVISRLSAPGTPPVHTVVGGRVVTIQVR